MVKSIMYLVFSRRRLKSVPRFTISTNIQKALDSLSFLPIQVESAMSKVATDIKDEVDSQIEADPNSESYIDNIQTGSFEITAVSYIEPNSYSIYECATDSIEKDINSIIGGDRSAY